MAEVAAATAIEKSPNNRGIFSFIWKHLSFGNGTFISKIIDLSDHYFRFCACTGWDRKKTSFSQSMGGKWKGKSREQVRGHL